MSLFKQGWRSIVGAVFLLVETVRIFSDLGIIKATSGALNLWQIYEFIRDHFWSAVTMLGVLSHPLVHALLIASGIGLIIWDNRRSRQKPSLDDENGGKQTMVDADKVFPPTVTQSPPTLAVGLYVSDVRFTFDDLEKNRRAEMTMRVFNGTGRAVEFSGLSGQLTFSAPNSADPERLPTPTLRHDVLKIAYPLQEWFFILEQRVPAQEADKMAAMIAADVAIHFDLTGLDISVFPKGEPNEAERLPLWGGLSCRHGICFGRIIHAVANFGSLSIGGVTK